MVCLVLKDLGQKLRRSSLKYFPILIASFHCNSLASRNLPVKPSDGETAFFHLLFPFRNLDDFRINKDCICTSTRKLSFDHKYSQTLSDLWRSDSHAIFLGMHGFF